MDEIDEASLLHSPVCDCGDCQQAIDEVLEEFQDMLAQGQCLQWAASRMCVWAAVTYLVSRADDALPENLRIKPRVQRLTNILGDPEVMGYINTRITAILEAESADASWN